MYFFDEKKRGSSLTKRDIAKQIEKRLRCSPVKSNYLLNETLEIIKSTLEKGEDVLISGFGRFCVKEKSARKGRNPAADKPMMLKKRRVVTFKLSGKLLVSRKFSAIKYLVISISNIFSIFID